MSIWRKLMLLWPGARRAEDRDIQEELDALRQLAGPGELGNLTLAAEDARNVQGWLWLERLGQDLRYALRSMRLNKAFAALVVTSLALGIGANTAIFSFMDAILLRPLPVRDPDSLVVLKWRAKDYSLATSGMMWSTGGSLHDDAGTVSSIFPYAALKVFDDANEVLSGAFGYFSIDRLSLTARDETNVVKGLYVSGTYFSGIGVAPIAGRVIQPADDVAGGAPIAVLSQRLSRNRFGSPEAAIDQTILVNNKPFTVVGVAPGTFFGAEPGAIPDVFIPMHADAVIESAPFPGKYTDDHLYWVEIMSRLKPGVSLEQAQAVLAARFRSFAESTATLDSQRQDLPVLTVQPGATGLDSLRRKYAQPIYILMAMVGLILVIACSNVANLLLSRAASRRREIAVRLSIGASRARVIRQLLTESVLLSSIGGAFGVAVGWWGIRVLTQLISSGRENFTLHAELNWTVLSLTLALSLLTGLLFGVAPALQATRVDVAPALKEVRGSQPARGRFGFGLGHTLVVAQIVLSLILLLGAGLFGRTLSKLHAIPLGFDREQILLFTVRPSTVGYRGPQLFDVFERIRAEVGRIPGVQSVSLSTAPLPMGGGTMAPVALVGATATTASGQPARAVLATVGPAFFSTMGIPIAGREFIDRDNAGAAKVVVVNKRLAAQYGVPNPIGRSLTMGKDTFEIVGVVDNALAFTLTETLRPIVYFPYLQSARPPGQMVFEARTAGAPFDLAPAVRQTVRQIDTRLAAHDIKTEAMHIDQAISTEITLSRLCTAFAALALLIACVGLYGTVAFNVARRTNEIGIRMTLGAQRGRIAWMVLRDVLVMTAIGLGIGIPLAFFGSKYVKTLLYGIEPTDPLAIAIAVGSLIVCAMAAGLIPARRASRLDPMIAVRHE